MDELTELEARSDELAVAIKSHTERRRRDAQSSAVNSDAEQEPSKTKSSIYASMAKMKAALDGPVDLLQDLARQVEIVACLKWLAEFQILACIPLDESMAIKDLADLAGVSEIQLGRVIRLVATSGILQEPITNYVSHTHLSAQFVTNQSLLDAAVFMAEVAVPTALQMPMATQRFGSSRNPTETAYSLALRTIQPFGVAIQEQPKLSRQWSAYLRHTVGLHQEKEIVEMLSQLKWSNLGNAFIVEVGAQSTFMAQHLAQEFPSLRLIVQINHTRSSSSLHSLEYLRLIEMMGGVESDSSSSSSSRPSSAVGRITVTYRAAGTPQPVMDAAVYILHLGSPAGAEGIDQLAMVRAELQDYLGILRASGGILLIPTTNLLPEPGSLADPMMEAVARAHDLSMLQLVNEGNMEMTELISVIKTIRDGLGRLVITKQLRSPNSLLVGLTVKHEASCI
ncbi:uncharacterized protein N7511_005204 [Penicillium nucicola]|uniref:uncharacterized protein n=1 Tax=Penicillium nucicola TaxID=1850975 RepID=UPI0025450F5D|nr:uncharacterized protein N7511_005204 [Penicillium nucicola]KAJ5761822.1 hypothetical protein N7511_005204 [Penicillium nucicola]